MSGKKPKPPFQDPDYLKWTNQYVNGQVRELWKENCEKMYNDDIDVISHPDQVHKLTVHLCRLLAVRDSKYAIMVKDPYYSQRKVW